MAIASQPTSETDPDPVVDHYQTHRIVYDTIRQSVEQTTEQFEQCDRSVQKTILDRAVTFALVSAQTAIEKHEKGYVSTLGKTNEQELAEGLLNAGVNYYKNKASYIYHNRTEVNYDAMLDEYDAYVEGDDDALDRMHRMIADNCKGVSTRKAAFAMAKCISTDKMCIDTHIAQHMGLDSDEIYNGVVIDRYENQCSDFLSAFPDELDHLPTFIKQWVAFDTHIETVTTHDVWFASLPHQIDITPPGWA